MQCPGCGFHAAQFRSVWRRTQYGGAQIMYHDTALYCLDCARRIDELESDKQVCLTCGRSKDQCCQQSSPSWPSP